MTDRSGGFLNSAAQYLSYCGSVPSRSRARTDVRTVRSDVTGDGNCAHPGGGKPNRGGAEASMERVRRTFRQEVSLPPAAVRPWNDLRSRSAAAEAVVAVQQMPNWKYERSGPGRLRPARLTKFVEVLDGELDANPSTAGPISTVLRMHFPLERCDIDEAFKISRKSKVFHYASAGIRKAMRETEPSI